MKRLGAKSNLRSSVSFFASSCNSFSFFSFSSIFSPHTSISAFLHENSIQLQVHHQILFGGGGSESIRYYSSPVMHNIRRKTNMYDRHAAFRTQPRRGEKRFEFTILAQHQERTGTNKIKRDHLERTHSCADPFSVTLLRAPPDTKRTGDRYRSARQELRRSSCHESPCCRRAPCCTRRSAQPPRRPLP